MGLIRDVAAGAIAGVFATAAMDVLWYRRYRTGGGDRDFPTWELSTTAPSFDAEESPAPAKVGKRIADAIGVELPDTSVSAVNNAVHWATGIGWGKAAGLAAARLSLPATAIGLGTGVVAWATSYATLVPLGIYEPITAHDRSTLWKDLSAHLLFGAVLGAVLAADRSLRR
jgi:hypothetical protein